MARLFIGFIVLFALSLPGAHGIALCVGHDGEVAVEAAVNGACAGSLGADCCDARADANEGESRFSFAPAACDHCGSCRDVILGSVYTVTPPPAFGNQLPPCKLRPEATSAPGGAPEPIAVQQVPIAPASLLAAHPPPPGGSAVLLL